MRSDPVRQQSGDGQPACGCPAPAPRAATAGAAVDQRRPIKGGAEEIGPAGGSGCGVSGGSSGMGSPGLGGGGGCGGIGSDGVEATTGKTSILSMEALFADDTALGPRKTAAHARSAGSED